MTTYMDIHCPECPVHMGNYDRDVIENPNKKAKKNKTNKVKRATINVRSLKHNESLIELEAAFNEKKIVILGLAEVRRDEERIIQTRNHNLFLHIRTVISGQRGVGFLINKKYKDKLVEFHGIRRIISLIFLIRVYVFPRV